MKKEVKRKNKGKYREIQKGCKVKTQERKQHLEMKQRKKNRENKIHFVTTSGI